MQVTILEGNKATDTGVVFVIDEGAYQKVWDVQFVGNTFVSGRRLKTQIQSKPPTLMLFSGFVDREKIDGDVDRLTAYYRSFRLLSSQDWPQAGIQRERQLAHADVCRKRRTALSGPQCVLHGQQDLCRIVARN